MSASLNTDRLHGALWGLFAGDALAMPVHWYYDLSRLRQDFGEIKGYTAPKEKLRGSILSLSSTSGGGRGGFEGNIIGDVINHGKRKFWVRGADFFYHCTLQKGENTLEGQIARLAIRSLAGTNGLFSPKKFVSEFITFMTTPGSHNDTYASTYIRMFFEQYAKGVAPELCPGNDNHNVDAMDALTVCGVVAVAGWGRGDDVAATATSVESFLRSLRKSDALPKYGQLYTELLFEVLNSADEVLPGDTIRAAATTMAKKIGYRLERAVAQCPGDTNPMTACYIDSALPAMLVILFKYADNPEKCLLASANAGGENVARGSVLGTILGAAYGQARLPDWFISGLHDSGPIGEEVGLLTRTLEQTSKSE